MSLTHNISSQSSIGDSSSWSHVQDKLFEEAIVVFPEGTQDRLEKIAAQVLGKSPLEVRRHYEVLVHDLLEIDSGRVELPSYEDEFDSMGQGSEYSEGPVDFGSKAKEPQRRRGVPWTEEKHRYNIQTSFHDPYVDSVSAMRLYKRMRAQDHPNDASEISTDAYKSQNVTSKFDSLRAKELEQMSPDELYEISRPNYKCWCLDSSQAIQP